MQYLWDVDGKQYLDFFGGIVTISVGHTNPRVTSKIKAQVDRLQHDSDLLRERCVLFVACTRAREALLVSWSGEPSPFLPSES